MTCDKWLTLSSLNIRHPSCVAHRASLADATLENEAPFTDQLLLHHLEHFLIIDLTLLDLFVIGFEHLPHFRIQPILHTQLVCDRLIKTGDEYIPVSNQFDMPLLVKPPRQGFGHMPHTFF